MNYYRQTDSDSQNLLSYKHFSQDGHGGRAAEHRAEMRDVARATFNEERAAMMEAIKGMILQAQYEAYEQALRDVLRVLEYDIHSVTRIGIDGCREIFEGEKAQRFISDQIMKRITKELKGKHFKK